FAREARVFKLPQAELKCLMLFEGHKYLTGVEIAGMLEVAKSRATVIIENLEKRGLVQRSADPNDARVKLISLTPAGQRKVREIEEFMFDLHQQLLGQIDPDQRAGVIAALETLRSSMEAVKAQFSK
ncbi:MAG: winged helix-turn-helix transcriptional regulator, partial [Deltaproteobacteria bacterium]|nr:winged helix-turn-helix transcriptional regulator [Deltaproteobacteria bacterium]